MTREEFNILDEWVFAEVKHNRDNYSRAKIIELIMKRVEELVNENDSLHLVSKCEPINSCDDEVIDKAIKNNLTMKFSDGTLRRYHDDWGQATPTHVYVC